MMESLQGCAPVMARKRATNPGESEQGVLDALRILEASLHATLGPDVLFVLVTICPGKEGREIWRASNCGPDALTVLHAAVAHYDVAGDYFTSTMRQ